MGGSARRAADGRSLVSEVAEPDAPLTVQIARLEKKMKAAAKKLEFEEAAKYRDRLKELNELQIFTEG